MPEAAAQATTRRRRGAERWKKRPRADPVSYTHLELQNAEVHAGVEAEAALLRPDGAVEFHTVPAVHPVSYTHLMGRATAALQRLASETGVDADALLDNPGLGSNPDVIRLLYQLSLIHI